MSESPYYRLDKPAGTYNFGLDKFSGPKNPELPGFSESYGSTPTLPRPLLGENHHLGITWDADYYAKIHRGILGPFTQQVKTESQQYNWSRIEFIPGRARPAIYGETPEIISRSQSFFQGTLQGAVPTGIEIPRGVWEEGIKAFNLMWAVQVNYLYESLEIFAQSKVYFRILNHPDPLIYFIRKKKRPITTYNVEDYLTNYVNPCVNCFRKLNGWNEFYLFDQKMMRTYFQSRLTDGRSQNWIYLLSPEADEHSRFRKQEDILYLYSGKEKKKYPNVSMEDYAMAKNNPKLNQDAVYQVPNFHIHKSLTLGKNMLSRNVEFPRYYRFQPYNMTEDEPSNSLDSYDIFIIDDKEKSTQSRVKYTDAVKAFPLDKIPQVFDLKNDDASFDDLVKKTIKTIEDISSTNDDDDININGTGIEDVVKPITKGKVKTPLDYYHYMLNMMKIDDIVNEIKSNINSIDVEKLKKNYDIFLNKVNPLTEFLAKYMKSSRDDDDKNRNKEYINAFFVSVKIPSIIDFEDFDLKNITIKQSVDQPNTPMEDIFTGYVLDDLKKSKVQNEVFEKIFKDIVLKKEKKHNFKDIAEDLLKINIDMPFGILLFKRQVYLTDSTPKVRKKSIDQLSQKLLANVNQDPHTGKIVIAVWKSFGERVQEPRDIKVYKDTFIKKSVIGGGNRFWVNSKKKRNIGYPNIYKYGDIWVVPVTLNEVLGPRINMINRLGFDDETSWDEVLASTNLRTKEENGKFYYSTYEKMCKIYKWDETRKGLNNEGSFFFNNTIIKEMYNHWAGWQKNVKYGTYEPEKGPFEDNHEWWKSQNPIINVRQVEESSTF